MIVRLVLVLGAIAVTSSCAPRPASPYLPLSQSERNPFRAQELTSKAVELMKSDPHQAEELLREALAADAWCGAAHNDLGVLYLNRGQLYEAANEFEWARKLMPGHPDPRMNLALTLEKAGRFEEALCTYSAALEVYPGHIPTMQAMSRLQVRCCRADNQTKAMLTEIALSGETELWRSWAQKQLIRLGREVGS